MKTAILTALLVLACNNEVAEQRVLLSVEPTSAPAVLVPRTEVTLSVELPSLQLESEALQAAIAWGHALGIPFKRVRRDQRPDITLQEGSYCGGDNRASACAGFGLPSTIHMIPGNYEFAARLIVMHEIGHALGAPHADVGLMRWTSPADYAPACPDATAVLAVAAAQVVAPRELAPCPMPPGGEQPPGSTPTPSSLPE